METNQRGKGKGKDKHTRRRKRQDDDALSLADDLNLDRVGRDHSSDSGLLDSDADEVESEDDEAHERRNKRARDNKKPYQQVKHVFDINVKELKNIPILARFIREAKQFENASLNRATGKSMEGSLLDQKSSQRDSQEGEDPHTNSYI